MNAQTCSDANSRTVYKIVSDKYVQKIIYIILVNSTLDAWEVAHRDPRKHELPHAARSYQLSLTTGAVCARKAFLGLADWHRDA